MALELFELRNISHPHKASYVTAASVLPACVLGGTCSVSPHELIQEVTVASKRKFVIGKQAEGVEFLR